MGDTGPYPSSAAEVTVGDRADAISARVERSLTVAGQGRGAGGRLAERTARRYRKYQAEYDRWRLPRGYAKEPTSESLAVWAGDLLLQHGYATSSVRARLSAMKSLCRERGWPVPDGVAAWSVLRGEDLTARQGGVVNNPGAAASRSLLVQVVRGCDVGRAAGVRDRCLVTLAWDILASAQELVTLDVDQVKVERDAVWVPVGGGLLRVDHDHDPPEVCAWCAAEAWVAVLRGVGVQRGPLFRPVDRAGNIAGVTPTAGRTPAQGRLNARGVAKIWARACVRAGVEPLAPRALVLGGAEDDVARHAGIVETLRRGRWSANTAPIVTRLAAVAAQAAAGGGQG